MRIWVVRDLEPIPTDRDPRLFRAGMFARTLAESGHETTWFTSTFSHYTREKRPAGTFQADEGLTINVLPAPGYKSNIGLPRIFHNHLFARRFLKHANSATALPDLIVTDLPTTETASAAVGFALRKNLPVVVSIRDLWPDFFADFVPAWSRPAARLVMKPLEAQARFACRHATSLIGISQGYLAWGQAKGGRRDTTRDRVFPLGYQRSLAPTSAELEKFCRELDISPGQHLVSFIGSWGATYDLELLLETAQKLSGRPDIVFLLAGNYASRPQLAEAFSRLPNVRLAGWIGPEKVAACLGRSAIGLLPYVADAPQGLPNKVFEYMAYGAYQISTLRGDAAALYAETGAGTTIPSRDPSALAAAIEKALVENAGQSERQRRISIFDERFDARRIYRDMVAHVTALAQR